jgi:uncharacterized protein (DUF433 family)
MSRYALSLPIELKREAEALAEQQGVSLNQFILWSVAEKVGDLKRSLDDPNFPNIAYRRGASGFLTPVLRGTGIRVQTIAISASQWGQNPSRIAEEYDLPESLMKEALAFYAAHRTDIDTAILAEEAIELAHD